MVFDIGGRDLLESEVYIKPSFSVDIANEIYDISSEHLSKVVGSIVQIEGPVRASEISRRVVNIWQLNRTDSRISRCVDEAVGYLSRRSKVRRRQGV
ncbi:DUF3320 domain-containing protein [bacterium]|nr:DUF3320 domain-containing protein [bacterium]